MDALRTAVSALAADDADAMSNEPDANRRKARRLAAQFPSIVTAFHRIREGLDPVRPNPFRSGTEVAFTLPAATQVSLGIYDLMGREVRAMARGERLAPGAHRMTWDGRRNDGGEAPAGVYFVRLRTATGHWSRPVLRVL